MDQRNNDVILSIGDIMSQPYEGESWLDLTPPGVPLSRRYIEDDDPEWRELNYDIEVVRMTRTATNINNSMNAYLGFRAPKVLRGVCIAI